MFKVEGLGTSYMGLRSVLTGTSFGALDQPLHFVVNAEGIDTPLRLTFFVRRDLTKGPGLCQASDIFDNQLILTFFNPAGSGSSGLKHPMTLVTVNGQSISIMFTVDSFIGAPFYKLSFEFFQSPPISWEQIL